MTKTHHINFVRNILLSAFSLMLLLATSSCEKWVYDNDSCSSDYRVNFVFERNMRFVDAFSTAVSAVTLYVYDNDGALVDRISVDGDPLKADNFYIPLSLPDGHYTLLAWCEKGDLDSFTYTAADQRTAGALQNMTCSIDFSRNQRNENEINHDINALFHGMATVDIDSDAAGVHTTTIFLTQNTNNVRILLQQVDGIELNPDDFDIRIIDNNGLMNYDNTLLGEDKITYRPWHTESFIVDEEGSDNVNVPSALLAEFTIGRMTTGHNARLVVTKTSTNETIISLPLYTYALMVKGYYNVAMEDQEYLDRQDQYNFTFFLDRDMNWLNASILINSWKIVLNKQELN